MSIARINQYYNEVFEAIARIAFFPSKETEGKFLEEKKEWIQAMGFEKNNFGGFTVYSK